MRRSRPQLILDIGGVLAPNLDEFWIEIAEQAKTPHSEIRSHYKQEISDSLWTGKITETEFWSWFRKYPTINIDQAREFLMSILKPLPAVKYIPIWSSSVDIHILSNHRIEWIRPLLEPVESYLTSVTISSQIGFYKPNPAIFKEITKQIDSHNNILFVDDSKSNLTIGTDLGWDTLLADKDGKWIETVQNYILSIDSKKNRPTI
ncbi:HAD family hydrolase [Aquibacillus kalidii]|uniref:HAD family hydrolase n=1 Tax=Aquibacillus kalidii TaxID=2762597 RepID=UPI001648774F|nr:HAD-IA family hydrolase [Aquibacillus kalidii]